MDIGKRTPGRGWKPPRWLFSVVAILLVAWWISHQPPPRGERPSAPSPEQNAHFEPSIPVDSEVVDTMPAVVVEETESTTETIAKEAEKPQTVTPSVSAAPKSKTKSDTKKKTANDPLIIPNVTIKDQSGRVAYRGEINLHPTLERIDRGEKFPHRNDGSTFRNLEGRLPKKSSGYYTEYVHPTPGINGPGPQRVVFGKDGEVFYTHDHYQSFRKVRE